MTLVQVALKTLTLSQECLSGQLKLGLPWDPFAQSVTAIETCRRNLQRLSAWNDKGDTAEHLHIRSRALSHSGEIFCKKNLQGDKQRIHKDDNCLQTKLYLLERKPLRKRKDCSSSRFFRPSTKTMMINTISSSSVSLEVVLTYQNKGKNYLMNFMMAKNFSIP